jgi:hypothetical protein
MTEDESSLAASFVGPTKNEVGYLADSLASIRTLDTDHPSKLIVGKGNSEDATRDPRHARV